MAQVGKTYIERANFQMAIFELQHQFEIDNARTYMYW